MIEYGTTINPTKFNTPEELAEFLAESYWWKGEWNGLNYDENACRKMLDIVKECDYEARGKSYPITHRITEKLKKEIIAPFWIEQLKHNYTFPMYFKREYNSVYGLKCYILSKEEYNNYLQNTIKELKEKIKLLKNLIED